MSIVPQHPNSITDYRQLDPNASMNQAPSMAGTIDVLGPILRRKLLIILLMILGCGAAYFAFTKATPRYESVARLMITSQAPPTTDGKQLAQTKVSIAKHERLIHSQLVLAAAAEAGDFNSMKTFEESDEMMLTLVEDVLKFGYSKKEDDSMLEISATGPDENELPVILTQIIKAYTSEIAKDSKISGEESLTLVANLRDQLVNEKKTAEESYLKILRRLNLPTVEQKGVPFNPFLDELDVVKEDRSNVITELRDISARIDLAKKAVESTDAGQVNYLATEAKKFLGVQIETVETIEEDRLRKTTNQQHIIGQYAQQAFSLEETLTELESQRFVQGQGMGAGHPTMEGIVNQIKSVKMKLKVAKQELAKLQNSSYLKEESEEEILANLGKRNRQWISIYLATLNAEKERLTTTFNQLDEDLALVEGKAKDVSADILELGILKERIAEKQKGIDEVLEQLSQINVVTSNFNKTKVRIIDQAGTGEQVAPILPLYLAIGLLMGGALGTGLAFLIDTTDNTFRNPNEITSKLSCPVIGKLPPIKIARKKQQANKQLSPALISLHDPTSEAAEAIRSARASIFAATLSKKMNTILMTSPSPGDGKSTACANLAVSIAQTGKSVVLVDADLRRPKIHEYFDRPLESGLLQILTGEVELADALQESGQENLNLLTAGGTPANPGEAVTSQRFRNLLEVLREKFDYVLIDSPPVLPVADPVVISSMVDGVYMIMRIRKGVIVTSGIAKEKLNMVGANLMGVIVNGVDDNPYYDDFGSHGYGYGDSGYDNYQSISGSTGKRLEFSDAGDRS